MKLTAKIKLNPTEYQHDILLRTLEHTNHVCNGISEFAFREKVFGKFAIQKRIYYEVRERSNLTAQMVIRAMSKVADAYKLDKKVRRRFKRYGAVAYDPCILKYKTDQTVVSIWTLEGRQTIPYQAGTRQHDLLQYQQGESDLVYTDGEFYLYATCDVPEEEQMTVEQFLGVDLGIVNIAADNDGDTFSGSHVNKVRHRNRNLRRNLQKKGTKSAKRRLKAMSGRESRFSHDTNHVIAKRIVEKAKRTQRGIALENLKGIRNRARVKKSQRISLNSWAFHDLGAKIIYKAYRAGVPVVFVDPAYTSQTCPCCGHVSKSNRKTRDNFCCVECGYAAPADTVGAINIALRGADSAGSVNNPDAVGVRA